MNPPERFADALPSDTEGPAFEEPWQAQAFALAVELHRRKVFAWSDWSEALGAELSQDPGGDRGFYFHAWVAALERLVARHAPVTRQDLQRRLVELQSA